MKRLALFLVPILVAACDTPPAPEPVRTAPEPSFDVTTETTDYKYHLVGQGDLWDESEPDLVINALRTFKGEVRGNVVVPLGGDGKIGTVLEVIAPSSGHDHWCVAATLDEVPGFVLLLYVDDSGNGKESLDLAAIEGNFSISCLDAPAPEFGFTELTGGDFKSDVKSK